MQGLCKLRSLQSTRARLCIVTVSGVHRTRRITKRHRLMVSTTTQLVNIRPSTLLLGRAGYSLFVCKRHNLNSMRNTAAAPPLKQQTHALIEWNILGPRAAGRRKAPLLPAAPAKRVSWSPFRQQHNNMSLSSPTWWCFRTLCLWPRLSSCAAVPSPTMALPVGRSSPKPSRGSQPL